MRSSQLETLLTAKECHVEFPRAWIQLVFQNASFQNTYMLFLEVKYCTEPLIVRHNKFHFVFTVFTWPLCFPCSAWCCPVVNEWMDMLESVHGPGRRNTLCSLPTGCAYNCQNVFPRFFDFVLFYKKHHKFWTTASILRVRKLLFVHLLFRPHPALYYIFHNFGFINDLRHL